MNDEVEKSEPNDVGAAVKAALDEAAIRREERQAKIEDAVEMCQRALVGALAKAKLGFAPIVKNRTAHVTFGRNSPNAGQPAYDFKYADLAGLIEATQKALAENELVVIQDIVFRSAPLVTGDGGQLTSSDVKCEHVRTRLMHAAGGVVETFTKMVVMEAGNQGYAKAQTFARRFGYQNILVLAGDEDQDAGSSDELEMTTAGRPVVSAARPNDLSREASNGGDDAKGVDVDLMGNYATRILELFDNQDPGGARLLWAELTQAEETYLWKRGGFTQKQKDQLRPNVPDKAPRGPRARA